MAIAVGETIPSVTFYEMGEQGPVPIESDALFSDKTIALFALPGAFTPTCSAAHLPGFVVKADELKAAGVDEIVCTSVNDAFVMGAWGKAQNAEAIRMLADGSADWADACGLTVDLTEKGMGVRSQRYAMIVKDGTVTWLGLDAAGQFENSSAEQVLANL